MRQPTLSAQSPGHVLSGLRPAMPGGQHWSHVKISYQAAHWQWDFTGLGARYSRTRRAPDTWQRLSNLTDYFEPAGSSTMEG